MAFGATAIAWPVTYSASEIRARVVDKQSGLPIQGAAVVARWVLLTELFGGGDSHYFDSVQDLEATTDVDGWFVIPAWGPKAHSPNSHLTKFSPQIFIFKSEYYGKRVANEFDIKPDVSTPVSDWNGKTIALRPFDGDWKAYVGSLNDMYS
ncbi:MAG: hypothetical protein ACRD9W_14800, partial [Terriglobia bacterium]